MRIHTRPDATPVGLTRPITRRQSAARRPLLTAFALAALTLLAACSGAKDPAEQLGASPVTIAEGDTRLGTENQPSDDHSPNQGDARATSLTLEAAGDDDGTVSNAAETDPLSDSSRQTTQPLDEPNEAIKKVNSDLKTGGQESLDAVEPLDNKPTDGERQGLREGSYINESGEQNVFDQAASLACADIEVALTALDETRNSDAVAHILSAADRAGNSSVATIDQWRPILQDSAGSIEGGAPGDIAPLLAFLSTCTQGGYEL